jgi:hypothetical protein
VWLEHYMWHSSNFQTLKNITLPSQRVAKAGTIRQFC